MSQVFVIGGGAAGMLAGVFAARRGHQVTIWEKNEKLGKKLFITGKGRCNLTNTCDKDIFFQHVMTNSKFLYSSFYGFHNQDVIDFFEEIGLKTKMERGGRVFPASDKSSDVIHVLERELKRLGVIIQYHAKVEKICVEQGQFQGLMLEGEKKVQKGDGVIVATGGMSYPLTGSTGDGYGFAEKLGHLVTPLSPSLVPFQIGETFVKDLMGLSLKNIQITVTAGKKEIYREFGEMIFTHFGVSGPVILSASSYLISYFRKKEEIILSIDLKPALTKEQMDARILRDFEEFHNKQFRNSLDRLLPKKMIPVIMEKCEIDPYKKVNLITKEERSRLGRTIKEFKMHVTGIQDYNEAVITKGGIHVKDINPSTMESKLVSHVYFVGEVLDLDALTGGFNLQIAWSTAHAAGSTIL